MTSASSTGYRSTAVRARNGMAVAGMVSGIVGLFVLGIILGPLAVIFGGIGLSRSKVSGAGRGQAIAGIILGVIDIVAYFVLVALLTTHGGMLHVA
jgi:Domain of unknown function (DUF4190)